MKFNQREAFRLCKEEFEEKKKTLKNINKEEISLNIDHIRQSYNKIYSSPYHQCLHELHENSKLFLISTALILKHQGGDFTYLSEVMINYYRRKYDNMILDI